MEQIFFLLVLAILNFEIKANLQSVFDLAETCLPDENFSKITFVVDPNVQDEMVELISEVLLQHQGKYIGSKLW
jgi:hypothetical protein